MIGATYSDHWDAEKDRTIAFLWMICLAVDWDSGTNDKTRSAFRQLKDLLKGDIGGQTIMQQIQDGFPDFDQVREASSKANIIFRTLMAFNLARGGIDWAGTPRSTESQEDHHIFPREVARQ